MRIQMILDLFAQIFARKFSTYLFFDQELGVSNDFTELAIRTAIGKDGASFDFSVYSIRSSDFNTSCRTETELPRTIDVMIELSMRQPEFSGFLVIGSEMQWFIFQENPTTLGVLGSQSSSRSTFDTKSIKENFLTCKQLNNFDKEKKRIFDLSFGAGAFVSTMRNYCNK